MGPVTDGFYIPLTLTETGPPSFSGFGLLMKRIVITLVGVIATFSAAIAATDSLLQRAQETVPAITANTMSAAQEPVSLSGALLAGAALAIAFLVTRRRYD
jgi:hypothetical protein